MRNDYYKLAALVNNKFDTVAEIDPLAEGLHQQSLQLLEGFGKVLPCKVRGLENQDTRLPRSRRRRDQHTDGTRQNGGRLFGDAGMDSPDILRKPVIDFLL